MRSKNLFLFICCILSLSNIYAKTNARIICTAKSYYKGGNGYLQCKLPTGLVKDVTVSSISIFAMNDKRSIPFNLLKNNQPLQTMKLSVAKPDGYTIIYSVALKSILTDSLTDGYSWKWNGRAKPPVSPMIGIAGEKVSKIKCWYVVTINDKIYQSDTVQIAIE